MHTSLKQFGRISGILVVAGAFLLLSAPHSVSIADDDIKALERKLELLKKKASRKNEYKQMRDMLGVKLKEVQDQIQMLDEEYKDVAKPAAPALVAKKKAAAGGFAEMIKGMENAEITMTHPGGEFPFKTKKAGNEWRMVQQRNLQYSEIKDLGKNRLSLNGFPSSWPINGNYKFIRDGSSCRIDQESGNAKMEWKC